MSSSVNHSVIGTKGFMRKDKARYQATLLRLQTPRHSPGIQADVQQMPPTPAGPPGAEKGTSVTSLSVQTPPAQ